LWTAQDPNAPETQQAFFRSWINPLENQSYSNNPGGGAGKGGRSNPILPQALQDRLEEAGIATSTADFRSTQTIDLKSQQVRNVVVVELNVPGVGKRRASITVSVDLAPNLVDPRRVDVKFRTCRTVVLQTPIDIVLPLGVFGPTGWLRTVYIDDSIRVTRGHKGSVFILQRPCAAAATGRSSSEKAA